MKIYTDKNTRAIKFLKEQPEKKECLETESKPAFIDEIRIVIKETMLELLQEYKVLAPPSSNINLKPPPISLPSGPPQPLRPPVKTINRGNLKGELLAELKDIFAQGTQLLQSVGSFDDEIRFLDVEELEII